MAYRLFLGRKPAGGATTVGGSLTASSVVLRAMAETATANAVVRREYGGSLTADALLRTVPVGSVSSDATIFGTRSGSLTADALLSGEQVGSLTADAVISLLGSGSFSVDAVIKAASTGSVPADAIVLKTISSTVGQSGSWGTNYATSGQGASASASSTYSSYAASNAIDGSDITRWSANVNAVTNEWLKVDLGQARSIGGVRVFHQLYAVGWVVEYSTDNSAWTPVWGSGGGASGNDRRTNFTPVSARWWRVRYTAGTTGNSLYAFELRDSVLVEAPPVDTNIASVSDFYVSATSTYSSHVATNMLDGNDFTKWTSNVNTLTSPQQYATFIGPTYPVSRARVLHKDYNLTYQLRSSPDGSTWTVRGTGSKADDLISFGPLEAGYWQVYYTSGTAGNSLYTFELWTPGDSGPTADAVILREQAGSFTASAVVSLLGSGSFAADAVIKSAIPDSLPADAIRKRTYVFGAGGSGVVGQDDFNTDYANLAGQPLDVGGLWSSWYATGSTTIASTGGVFRPPVTGSSGGAWYAAGTADSLDADHLVTAALTDELSEDTGVVGVFARGDGTTTKRWYEANVDIGGVAQIYSAINGTATLKASYYPSSGTFPYRIRFKVNGSNPTTLSVRSWSLSEPEPSDWASTTDTNAYLQDAGRYGIKARRSTSASSLGDDYLVIAAGDIVDGPGPTLDALIRKTQSGSLTAAALLKRTQTGTLATDAVIAATVTSSLTAEAWIAGSGISAITADAILAATGTGSFSVAATLKAARSGSALADAIRKRTMVFGAGGGGVVATDTFTGISPLTAHTPDSGGGTWTQRTPNIYDILVEGGMARCHAGAGEVAGEAIAVLSNTLNDGWAQAYIDGTYTSYPTGGGVTVRGIASGGWYGYTAQWRANSYYPLTRLTNGSHTTIGSIGGTGKSIRIQATGTSPTSIKVERRATIGELGTGWHLETTDNTAANQTTTGKPGILIAWDDWESSDYGSGSVDDFTAYSLSGGADGPGPTADAVIRKERTGTLTAAAILKQTQTGSFSADAILAATGTGSFSADAEIIANQTEGSGSFSADAVLLAVGTGSLAADALIAATLAGNLTVDAVVLREQAGSLTAAASIKAARTNSLLADAIRKRTWVFGAGGDRVVVQDSFTGSPVLLAAHTPEVGGSWTNSGNGGSLSISAGWLQRTSGQWVTDVYAWNNAAGAAESSVSLSQSVSLRSRNDDGAGPIVRHNGQGTNRSCYFAYQWSSAPSFRLFRVTSAVVTQLATASGYYGMIRLEATGTNPTTLRARSWSPGHWEGEDPAVWVPDPEPQTWDIGPVTDGTAGNQTGEYVGVRAFVSYSNSTNIYVDDFLAAVSGGAVDGPGPTADAVIRKERTGSLTAAAVLRREQAGSFSASAWVQGSGLAAFTVDAVVRRAGTAALTADSIFTRTSAEHLTTDAIIAREASGTFAASAEIATGLTTETGSLTADAVLASSAIGSSTADATLLAQGAGTFSASALVQAARFATLSADAVTLRQGSGSTAAEASIGKTTSAGATADAVVLAPRMDGVDARAVFHSRQTGQTLAEALLRITVSGSWAADAQVLSTLEASFTGEASVTKPVPGSFTASAVIDLERTDSLTATLTTIHLSAVNTSGAHLAAVNTSVHLSSVITSEHLSATLAQVHVGATSGWPYHSGRITGDAVIV